MYVCLNVSLRLCFLHKKIQKHSFSVCISYAFPSFFYLPARIFLCKRYMNKFLGISFLCFNRLLTWNIDQMNKKSSSSTFSVVVFVVIKIYLLFFVLFGVFTLFNSNVIPFQYKINRKINILREIHFNEVCDCRGPRLLYHLERFPNNQEI